MLSSGFSEKSIKFSKKIDELRNLLGLKTSALERHLGLSNGYINNFLKSDAENPGKLLVALNEQGISTDWFLTGEGTPFIKQGIGASAGFVPPVSGSSNTPTLAYLGSSEVASTESRYKVPLLKQKVSCGPGVNWESKDNIEEYIAIETFIPNLGLGRIFAMKVNGSSMIGAGIKDGDYLLFEAEDNPVPIDGIYVFALDGDIFCKRLEFDRFTKKLFVYSMRNAEVEKAELVASFDTTETSFSDRFFLFGRVVKLIRTVYSNR